MTMQARCCIPVAVSVLQVGGEAGLQQLSSQAAALQRGLDDSSARLASLARARQGDRADLQVRKSANTIGWLAFGRCRGSLHCSGSKFHLVGTDYMQRAVRVAVTRQLLRCAACPPLAGAPGAADGGACLQAPHRGGGTSGAPVAGARRRSGCHQRCGRGSGYWRGWRRRRRGHQRRRVARQVRVGQGTASAVQDRQEGAIGSANCPVVECSTALPAACAI